MKKTNEKKSAPKKNTTEPKATPKKEPLNPTQLEEVNGGRIGQTFDQTSGADVGPWVEC